MSTAVKKNPGLWKRIVANVKAGSKGGDASEWSARKAQLAVALYKKSGGGYQGKKSSSNSLSKWTKQKWTTFSGKPSDGMRRYLPEKAWKSLSPSQRKSTNQAKAQGNLKGQQFVKQPKKIAEKVKEFR
jgi:hypothetical protein